MVDPEMQGNFQHVVNDELRLKVLVEDEENASISPVKCQAVELIRSSWTPEFICAAQRNWPKIVFYASGVELIRFWPVV